MQNRIEEFKNTIQGKPSDKPLIWLMRQAGRFLKSYRSIKDKYTFLEMCTNPELVSKITITPLIELNVDAMILFSDILIPLKAYGATLTYKENAQPFVNLNIKNLNTVYELEETLCFITESIKIIKNSVKNTPLIGFAGAPFTVACYLLGSSKNFYKARSLIYKNPNMFKWIMDKLSTLTIQYLTLQIKAGCDAVQLFDSWGGIVSREIYENFIYPYNDKIASAINAPFIYYINSSSHLNVQYIANRFDCISVDWRINIANLSKITDKCIQGNLDNAILFTDKATIKSETYKILHAMRDKPHIFNVGEGIMPNTNENYVKYLVDVVHEFK